MNREMWLQILAKIKEIITIIETGISTPSPDPNPTPPDPTPPDPTPDPDPNPTPPDPTPDPTPDPDPNPTPPDPTPPDPTPAPPQEGWVPRMPVKLHGNRNKVNWLPDYAATPQATLISSFDNLPPSKVLVIPENKVVLLNKAVTQHIEVLCIKGTLLVDDVADTSLNVGTILVYPTGKFIAGTTANPISGSFRLEFSHMVDVTEDPDQFMVGLVAAGGEVSMVGNFSGKSYAKILSSNGSQFVIEKVEGWKVGDEIILACSRKWVDPSKGTHENEIRKIKAINQNPDNTVIEVNEPLTYQHDTYIANITRNISVESVGGDPAHMLFGYTCKLTLHGVDVDGLGRTTTRPLNDTIRDANGKLLFIGTNQRARYPVHVHHNSSHAIITGCVVHPDDEAKWAITIHDSSATVSNNVVYGLLDGAGIVAEEGNEVGEFNNNIVISFANRYKSRRSFAPDYRRFKLRNQLGKPLFDRAFSGFGLWLAGPYVAVTNNAVIGVFTEAYNFNPEKLTQVEFHVGPMAGQVMDLQKIAPTTFENNYASGTFLDAIRMWGFKGGTLKAKGLDIYVNNHFAHSAFGIGHVSGLDVELINCRFDKHPDTKSPTAIRGTYQATVKLTNTEIINWSNAVGRGFTVIT